MALGFTASADSSSAFDSGVTPVGRRMHASRIAEGERRALEKFVVGEVNAPGPYVDDTITPRDVGSTCKRESGCCFFLSSSSPLSSIASVFSALVCMISFFPSCELLT